MQGPPRLHHPWRRSRSGLLRIRRLPSAGLRAGGRRGGLWLRLLRAALVYWARHLRAARRLHSTFLCSSKLRWAPTVVWVATLMWVAVVMRFQLRFQLRNMSADGSCDLDGDDGHRVVPVLDAVWTRPAAPLPQFLSAGQWLGNARGVGGPSHDESQARSVGLPPIAPSPPTEGAERIQEGRRGRVGAPVGTDLDRDRSPNSPPSRTRDLDLQPAGKALAEHRLRNFALDAQVAQVLALGVLLRDAPVSLSLVISVERLANGADAGQPLHRVGCIATGEQSADGPPVGRRQRATVHLHGEHRLGAQRRLQRNAAGERAPARAAGFHALVRSLTDNLHHARAWPGRTDHLGQRGSGELSGARPEPCPAPTGNTQPIAPCIPRALQGDGDLVTWRELGERQRERLLDLALDGDGPLAGLQRRVGYAKVIADEEAFGRRDPVFDECEREACSGLRGWRRSPF